MNDRTRTDRGADRTSAPTLDEFLLAVEEDLRRPRLRAGSGLDEICPSDLDRYLLATVAARWTPDHLMPTELDPTWATLADVHYYLGTHLARTAPGGGRPPRSAGRRDPASKVSS
jgi:hypothetical protein